MQLQFKLDPLQSETGPSQTEAVQAQFFFLTPCLDGGCQIVKMCLMKPWMAWRMMNHHLKNRYPISFARTGFQNRNYPACFVSRIMLIFR